MQTLPAKPRVRVPARSVQMNAVPVAEVETAHHAASLNAKDMASWAPMRVSPDAALLNELDTIVARSDDLVRNNGIAAGAKRTFKDNVVGPRVLCKPNPDRIALGKSADWADGWSREVESLAKSYFDTVWFDAGQRHTFHSATRLQIGVLSSSGECLALPLWLPSRGSRWNTCIQLVDPARLSNPNNRSDEASLRSGVEMDRYGAPVAHHIRKTHPGDFFGLSSGLALGEWQRIPTYTPWGRLRVIHLFDADDIGQSRGKPIITSVARQFKMLDHYMREELRLAVLNAMIFAALETPLDQESQVELLGGDRRESFENSLKEWRVQMRGGAIIPMPPGTKLNPFIPTRPTNALDSFATVMLRNIATGLNIPYELVFKDFSKTNYSSARAALLEGWRYFQSCRQLVSDGWCAPNYELWFEEAVNRGEIPDCTPQEFYSRRLAWTQAKWIYAGRGWIDPTKEAQAADIRMNDAQISTLEIECAEQGLDWREVQEQRAREMKNAKSLGLEQGPKRPVAPSQDAPADAIAA